MEQNRLKKYGIFVDIWLGLSVLATLLCCYIFIVISVEMADFCASDDMPASHILKFIYEYAGCVIDWPSFFGQFILGLQFWFCILIFPALLTRNAIGKSRIDFKPQVYYPALLIISIILCYLHGYYYFLGIPALRAGPVEDALHVVMITLMMMIPLHYLCRFACFLQKRWRRQG